MGLKTKTGRVLDGRWDECRWVQVRGSFCCRWYRLLTGSDAAGFLLFCCRRRCPPRHFCWPQQALSNRKFPLQLASLLDPKGLALPSGQDVLARQLSRQPIGLVFTLVWAPLRRVRPCSFSTAFRLRAR